VDADRLYRTTGVYVDRILKVQEADKPRDPSGNEKEIYSSMVIEVVAFALLAESLRHSGRFKPPLQRLQQSSKQESSIQHANKPCAQREAPLRSRWLPR